MNTATHRITTKGLNDAQWEMLSSLVDDKQGALYVEDQNGGADDEETKIAQQLRDILDEAWGG